MMKRAPIATLALAAVCLFVQLQGGADAFAYERDQVTVMRLVTASFAHYDWRHLAGNLVGLLLLGSIVERERGAAWLVCLCAATLASTMLVLHVLLPACVTFAGISNINYALLAFILCTLKGRQLAGIGMLGIVAALELTGMDGRPTLAPVQPVWQLHLLALSIGAGMALLLPGKFGGHRIVTELRRENGSMPKPAA